MYVAVEQDRTKLFLTASPVLVLMAMACVYGLASLKMRGAWFGFVLFLFAISLIGLAYLATRKRLLAVIDEDGILDTRIGIGRILWSDIEDVQLEVAYGNRFLCFRVRTPERYVEQLSGVQHEKAIFHRKLGFQRFNIDIRGLDCDLVELKHQIDIRIAQHRHRAQHQHQVGAPGWQEAAQDKFTTTNLHLLREAPPHRRGQMYAPNALPW